MEKQEEQFQECKDILWSVKDDRVDLTEIRLFHLQVLNNRIITTENSWLIARRRGKGGRGMLESCRSWDHWA